jgi:hypothetical protein
MNIILQIDNDQGKGVINGMTIFNLPAQKFTIDRGMLMRINALIMPVLVIVLLVIAATGSALNVAGVPGDTTFSRGAIETAIGAKGTEMPDGVFMVSLPRDDPGVRVGNITLSPAMALDSWVGFAAMGHGAMMMGDLVLTADEMLPVQGSLQRNGISITAIHNTLIGESPQVYDLHIGGEGDPVRMAGAVRNALDSAGVPYHGSDNVSGTSASYTMDAAGIDRIIGTSGTLENGVLHYRVPRAEKIMENGMEVPASFDVANVLKFQPLPDNRAAVAGEFVLIGPEVNPVIRALNDNGILVTATHTHMLAEEPRLFYLHFWATGDQTKLARGLREALDRTNSIMDNQIPLASG